MKADSENMDYRSSKNSFDVSKFKGKNNVNTEYNRAGSSLMTHSTSQAFTTYDKVRGSKQSI